MSLTDPCLSLQVRHHAPETLKLFIVPTQNLRYEWAETLRAQFQVVSTPEAADYLVVMGGDGSMLHAIHEYDTIHSVFFGLNAGTLGFLMNHVVAAQTLEMLFQDIVIEQLWMLEAEVVTTEGQTSRVYGFNDIWVERDSGQTLKMIVTLDGARQPAMFVGDGLLFSTPQGSTGYNRALHGKVILPGVPVLQMTPIACVVDKIVLSSLLLCNQSVVTIEFYEPAKRPCRLLYDGKTFSQGTVQRFTVRKSQRQVRIGFTESHTFRSRVTAWQLQY